MINQLLDPFYPIVSSAQQFENLGQLAVPMAQLRIKDKQGKDLRQEIEKAFHFSKQYNIQLILNDFWEIAIDIGIDFLHLGQKDLQDADLKTLKAKNIRFGVSTQHTTELEVAMSADPDYIAFGPIFHTTSKVTRFGPQGVDRIHEWRKLVGKKPLVTIGGLTIERAIQCLEAGADSVALISAIQTDGQIDKEKVQAWLKMTQEVSKKG